MSFAAPIPNALLSARSLAKKFIHSRFPNGAKISVDALRGVDLDIARGQSLALVGESGAGKSTLVRCLALLERPSSGEIRFDGRDLLALGGGDLFRARREIQLVFQDPASSMNPRMTAAEILAEPLVIQREGTKDTRRRRVAALFDQVRLPPAAARRLPFELSGGQRQRLAIARALALQPQLVIFDEAFSNLDLATRDSLAALLADLQAAHRLTYLHVSHDLTFVAEVAAEVAVMRDGKIIERASTQDLFTRPQTEYARLLLEAAQPFAPAKEEIPAAVSR